MLKFIYNRKKEKKMRDTTREIFDKYQVRKTKAQKQAFRDYLISYAKSQGYEARTESAGKSAQNVVVGDPKSAEVVYTAHYDTCAIMPFPNFITPKCIPIYLLYQIVLSLIIYIIPLSVIIGSRHVLNATGSSIYFLATFFSGYVLLILFTMLLLKGPANKHTANDNTSGVTLLIDVMTDMPDELRAKAAYIFFDLEEMGTLGSKGYAMRHKTLAKQITVVNFDCVSDGKNILFVVKKKATDFADKLAAAFKSNETYTVDITTKGAFYPSDQRNFERGIGVSALNKTEGGLLYMNKIHTKRDTVYDEANIEFLKDGAIELVSILSKSNSQSVG